MKYCIIIPDGMADFPLRRLEGRTPLEAAPTPNMDRAAREGRLGVAHTVPRRLGPGSDVAIMSLLGYDPLSCYTGRGPLEAADTGIQMEPGDWAFRCNLVTVTDNVLADFTAGHISTKEAALLIESLNEALSSERVSFHLGIGYRHLMLYRVGGELDLETAPPHDVTGEDMTPHLPQGRDSEPILDLMERSTEVLAFHDVNTVRCDLGQNPANMIWLWGQGRRPRMEAFHDRFGLHGCAISAVKLVRGIARIIGWHVLDVPGATGYVDTDFAAKGRYALDALRDFDLVLVHVEAPDEAAHEGDLKGKIQAIREIDGKIVGPIMEKASERGDMRILISPDHLTPVEERKHRRGPVPFAIWGEGVSTGSGRAMTERDAEQTGLVCKEGYRLMEMFLGAAIG